MESYRSNLRIIFICSEYPPAPGGGIGTMVKTMAAELTKLGCTITVIGFDPTVQDDLIDHDNGVDILRLYNPFQTARQLRIGRYFIGVNSLRSRRYLSKRLEQLISEFRPSLVESYDWSGPLWSKPSVPLVVRLHGAHTAYNFYEQKRSSLLLRFYESRNLRIANRLCAVSAHIGDLTLRAFNLKREYDVLYNFVDTTRFLQAGVKRQPLKLLFVGRVERRKGVTELFYVLRSLFKLNSEISCDLAGQVNGSFKDELLGILDPTERGRVSFLGKVAHADLPAIYSSAAVFMMPSRAEAFGLTAVEAMACGTPVILTKKASSYELVEDGLSGLLLDFADSDSAALMINKWVSDDKLLAKISVAGRERAVAKFSVEAAMRANLSFYNDVLQKET